jgi:hypothetical protein
VEYMAVIGNSYLKNYKRTRMTRALILFLYGMCLDVKQ